MPQTKTETPKRAPRRTDREIAQDKLDAARLKVEGMVKRETALAEELRLLRHARAAAEERRDYLAKDPALKVQGAGAPPVTTFQPDA